MLNNIKSSFILKKIFLFIFYDRKVKLVVYNKKMQNILGLDIRDLMRVSGSYIIGERNGYIKEYNSSNDKLIFEGEYLNGNRNGIGKEYNDKGKIIFEGEYLNNKKSGYGKKYNYFNNKLIYEGEYLNGRRNGKGKEYSEFGYLLYEAEYLNNIKNGKGKEYNHEGKIIFEGEYLNDKNWNGNETIYMSNNYNFNDLILEIKYLNGFQISFYGKEYTRKTDILVYEGEYHNFERNGKGKEYYEDNGHNLKFEGEYVHNHRNRGKRYYNNGNIKYEGEYLFDKKWNGKGYDEKGNLIYEIRNGKKNKIKEIN